MYLDREQTSLLFLTLIIYRLLNTTVTKQYRFSNIIEYIDVGRN